MADQKNLLLAIVISVAIILGAQFLLPGSKPPAPGTGQQTAGKTVPGGGPGLRAPGAGSTVAQPKAPGAGGSTASGAPRVPGAGTTASPPVAPGAPGTRPNPGRVRAAYLKGVKRVRIETPKLTGTISLTGARLDDLTMLRYRQQLPQDAPKVTLLEPVGAPNAYFVEYGWVPGAGQAGLKLPTAKTVWTADGSVLRPGQPITLAWDNGAGLRFERKYEIDKDYLITVIQRVVNKSDKSVTLHSYALVKRYGTPETSGWYVLDEGPFWVTRPATSEGGTKTNYTYDSVKDDKNVSKKTVGGWVGLSDRYWMVSIAPKKDATAEVGVRYRKTGNLEFYQADIVHQAPVTIPPGLTSAGVTSYLYAGAKEIDVITKYQDSGLIERIDLSMDYGWFFFLTKPIFQLVNIFNNWVGNFGVAILLLTVMIKIIFFPLANKSYKAMGKMKALTPKMQQIKQRFGDNKEQQNRELMELYKREKVNPMAGCWPILIQIPVFFALYKVLLINIEMRHAPFFWWIQDLSARDPTSVLNLFGLLPFTPPTDGLVGIISIGIWPLLMGVSMWAQQRLNPAPPDPVQARIFMMLPIVFTFMLAPFAAGLVIYWTWNNLLSMAQQWTIMKRHGQLSQATAPTAGGPAKKTAGAGAGGNSGRRAKAKAAADGDEASGDGANGDGADGNGAEGDGADQTDKTPASKASAAGKSKSTSKAKAASVARNQAAAAKRRQTRRRSRR